MNWATSLALFAQPAAKDKAGAAPASGGFDNADLVWLIVAVIVASKHHGPRGRYIPGHGDTRKARVLGIRLPVTMHPPGLVARTIPLAISKRLGPSKTH